MQFELKKGSVKGIVETRGGELVSFKDKEGRFSAKVKLKNHYLLNTEDTLFDTTFDTACMLFNSKTDFETIKNFFELRFDVEIIKRKIGKLISSKNPIPPTLLES